MDPRQAFTPYVLPSCLSALPTHLPRQKVLGLFGGREAFVAAHQQYSENLLLKKMILEGR
ncbi:MAG: hypothetical protein EOO14_16710 [Chitinophagaceae bacterium]|nr:MAG: hypothetical protein EOO14_16710 [Chitinophagaceae bacterium]